MTKRGEALGDLRAQLVVDRDPLGRGRTAEERLVHVVEAPELADRLRVVVHAKVDEDVGETRVAAVMFASVYRSIEDLSAFEAELRRLESEPVAGPDQLSIEVLQDGGIPSADESTLATPSGGRSKGRRNAKTTPRRGHASHK